MCNCTISLSDIEEYLWETEAEYDSQRYKRIGDLSDWDNTDTMIGNGVSWHDFI